MSGSGATGYWCSGNFVCCTPGAPSPALCSAAWESGFGPAPGGTQPGEKRIPDSRIGDVHGPKLAHSVRRHRRIDRLHARLHDHGRSGRRRRNRRRPFLQTITIDVTEVAR